MIPWDRIAQQYGYKTVDAMFLSLYPKQSITQLAQRFGCSATAIRDALKKAGCNVRNRGGANVTSGLDKVSLEEFNEKGARIIADEYDVDITTVYKHFKRRRAMVAEPATAPSPPEE